MWTNGSHLESTLPIRLLDQQTARVELADVKIVGKDIFELLFQNGPIR